MDDFDNNDDDSFDDLEPIQYEDDVLIFND